MVISRKLIKPLEMNSQILQQGTNHKHLGLFFSNNGLWHDHIDYIVKKVYIRLSMLRKVRFILNRFTLEKMYFSFNRSILEYGNVVWDTQTHYLINKIENVQSEAARIATGSTNIRLKIKPNSARIRFLNCQIFVLPSTGFELTPLIHCSTNRLALYPAP